MNYLQFFANYCTRVPNREPLKLYKYLLRQCQKLPNGPRQHYTHTVKQCFLQYVKEPDPSRVEEIIKRAYEDSDWIFKKYLGPK